MLSSHAALTRPLRTHCARCCLSRRMYGTMGTTSHGARIAHLASQQDPYRRIRFHKPYRRFFERGSFSKIDLHYLPFWNVFYSWSTKDLKRKRGTAPEISTSCTGVSICAVQESHWASGMIYDLDPGKWARQPTEALPSWLDNKDFLEQQGYWNEAMISPFGTGYPKALPRSFFADVEGRSFETRVLSTFAFPVYRPVHRFTLTDQTMAVGDAASADQSIIWDGARLNYPTKRLDPRPEVTWSQWTKVMTLQRRADLSMPIGSPSTVLRTFQELGSETKMAPLIWRDEKVLPAATHGNQSMSSAWNYLLRQSRQKQRKDFELSFDISRGTPDDPIKFISTSLYAQPSASTTLSDMMFGRSNEISQAHLPNIRRPLSRMTYTPDGAATSDMRSTLASRANDSTTSASSMADSNMSMTISEPLFRAKPARPLPTPPRLLPPISPITTPPSTIRPTASAKPSRPTPVTSFADFAKSKPKAPIGVVMALMQDRIPDPEGWYAILGIKPVRRIIDPLDGEYGSRLVTEAKIRLNKMYHPDRGEGADEDKLGMINQICEELKSVSTRIKYSNRQY